MRLPALFFAFSIILGAQEPPMPKPTPHHLAMKSLEGTWDAVVKMHMAPGKPPMESKGVEVNKLVLGGLWIQSEFTSEMMGAPFEGRGLFGYDPATRKHVGTWVDSMTTSMALSTGTCKNGCKEMTCFFKAPGMDGKLTTFKEVSVEKDPDHRAMTMFIKGKDGAYTLNMEIEYTRRK
jgi:hypothetical protein